MPANTTALYVLTLLQLGRPPDVMLVDRNAHGFTFTQLLDFPGSGPVDLDGRDFGPAANEDPR